MRKNSFFNRLKGIIASAAAVVMAVGMSVAPAMPVAAATNSHTITVTGAKEGETYSIYKMLDVDVDSQSAPTAFSYYIPSEWTNFWTSTGAGASYITGTSASGGNTYVSGWNTEKQSASDMEEFGKAAAKYVSDADPGLTKAATDVTVAEGSSTAEFSVTTDGYYLITSTAGTAVTVATVPGTEAANIHEKNNVPTVDKEVKEQTERNTSGGTWGATNDDEIGKTVEFTSEVKIPRNSTKVVYHDTMEEGLTYTSGSVKVYTVNPKTSTEDQLTAATVATTNYTVNAPGANSETFTVSFTQDYLNTITPTGSSTTSIYIYYTATLNNKAVVNGEGQKNTAKVTYGDAGETEDATTTTYTRAFLLVKYDSADNQSAGSHTPIAGAHFKLYTQETGGTALTLYKNGNTYRVYNSTAGDVPEGYTAVDDNEIVTVANTPITIEGVDSDNYYLEETQEPQGYRKVSGRTLVEVGNTSTLVRAEISNTKGNSLPETGGIGTTIFYVIGGCVVAAALALLVAKKRKNA